jgi:hypothetical protein
MATPLHERLRLHGVVRSFWYWLKQDLFDTYRRELHYMRGPGPKGPSRNKSVNSSARDV